MKNWPLERLPPLLRPTLTREVGLVIVSMGGLSLALFAAAMLMARSSARREGLEFGALEPYLWGAAAAVLFLSAGGLWATSRRIAAPVRRVARAARAVAYGEYSRRLHEDGLFDELGDLARSFDAMAARVEETVAALNAERRFSDVLLERFPEGVAVVEEGGRIAYANPAFRRLLPGPGFGSAEGLVREALEERRTGLRARLDLLPPEEAMPRHLRLSAVPFGEADAMRALVIVEDETSDVLAEHQKNEWQDMLIHDVKSPLSVLLGTTKVLRMSPRAAEEDRLLAVAERAGDRIVRLLDTYLEVLRMEAGARTLAKERVSLAEAAAAAVGEVAPLAEKAGMSLSVEVPAVAVVPADRELLRRLLVNLLDNAVKYAAAGRRAVVRAAPAAGGGWRLAVSDQGPGVAPADLPFVFERFYRSRVGSGERKGGTGLGLAFCRLAARLHGWELRAESEPGKGTEMVVDIPGGGDAAA